MVSVFALRVNSKAESEAKSIVSSTNAASKTETAFMLNDSRDMIIFFYVPQLLFHVSVNELPELTALVEMFGGEQPFCITYRLYQPFVYGP